MKQEDRDHLSTVVRAMWLDPVYRNKVVNGLRAYYDDPYKQAVSRRKVCPNGHAKTYDNTSPSGRCMECRRVANRESRERQRTRERVWNGIFSDFIWSLPNA